ncbi:MAG: Smr/MutS family protein [Ferruginibacter sp.]
MKYQIGDKIIVLHSDEEGTVIEIINDKMVMIEVRGVKFPAYMDQIDFPYFKMFTQKKIVPEKKKIYVEQIRQEKKNVSRKVKDGVFINFIPVFDKDVFEDDVVEKLKVVLVNQNEEAYGFTYNLFFSGESNFMLTGRIEPVADFYLHDISFEDMNDSPRFEFEFSLVNNNKKKAPYFEVSLKLKAKQLFKKIEEIQLKSEPSFSYELFISYPDKTEEEKIDLSRLGNNGFRLYDASRVKENLPPARSVVDLHIDKLTDNYSRLTPFEIMNLQLNTFEKYYDLAVSHYQSTLIIIHGIGEGRLRDEIHEILRLKKEVKSFVNQFHPLYGFGATEIYFKNF